MWRELWAAVRGRAAVWLVLWGVAQAAPVLVFGRAMAGAVDAFLHDRLSSGLIWLAVLCVAALAGAVASGRTYGPLAAIVEPFRDALVRRVVGGAVRQGGERPDHAAVARLTHQVEIVRDTFAGTLLVVRDSAAILVGALVGMATLLPSALVLVLPPLFLGFVVFFAVTPMLAARQRDAVLAEERIAVAATGLGEGLRDIVACGAEDVVGEEAAAAIEAQRATACAAARLAAVRACALALGSRVPLVTLLVGAPWLLRHGGTPGTILGAMAYVLRGLEPALHTAIRGLGGSGVRLMVTLERILTADGPPARVGGSHRLVGGSVLLRGVGFAYGEAGEPVLQGLDLEIAEGEHLAVVGPSGIGKSTLAALVTGMLAPTAGEVLLGRPGEAMTAACNVHPAARVLIPQEAYVFSGTLHDNLVYLCPEEVTLGELEKARSLFGLTELSAGLDDVVDPDGLSSGERQLIALARAWLSPARVVVLDEATCHLDAAAEARAERAFAGRGGTLVVVAHRMSSARRADRILVLDGVRACVGTHEELLGSSALYRDLCGHWDLGSGPGSELGLGSGPGSGLGRGPGSEPAGILRDADGVDAVAGPGLADDP